MKNACGENFMSRLWTCRVDLKSRGMISSYNHVETQAC